MQKKTLIKKILIFGGTGFVGSELVNFFKKEYTVTLVSRKYSQLTHSKTDDRLILCPFAEYARVLAEQDVIINLIGENVIKKPWTAARKKLIFSSRVDFTKKLVAELKNLSEKSSSKKSSSQGFKQKLLINASAVGIYPNLNNQKSRALKEHDIEKDLEFNFLAGVVHAWEREANRLVDGAASIQSANSQSANSQSANSQSSSQSAGFRVVTLRLGLVLDRFTGVFPLIYLIHKLGLGGALGSGLDAFSWIALKEIPLIVEAVIKNPQITGPINTVSPELIDQSEFSNQLAKKTKRPNWFKIPPFILKLLLGNRANLILNTPFISADKLLGYGYKFKYATLADLINQKDK